ncbi:hypothetical protein MTX78_18990 [Hymenobacter tibetensis]|uniref:Uncharacterized protein n=1 Tax=Hymenobacter tibetensis TaxID=497967 RepID=A0ABY4CV95_9BACT|nr:hypothetical protein [Hymenobacter tibetensis]UOG74195.1 hypothetical protein MTX78_18990 [Hymenobacter tibetensis]
MITKFKVSKDHQTVSWQAAGQPVELHFQYPVEANYVKHLNQVIVQSDIRESGQQNLALYVEDGSVKVRPPMPKLEHEVTGVYAVWFVPGEDNVTTILLTDEYKPYDTACTFDLRTGTLSDLHATK